MQKSQVNRAVIAARATGSTRRPSTVGTNPAMRGTIVGRGGNVGRQYGAYNRGGSGDAGYSSEWSRPTDAPFGGWQ